MQCIHSCLASRNRIRSISTPINILVLQSRHPSGERRYCGGWSGHLITSSNHSVGIWWKWGGLAQRRPASYSYAVALGWKLTLCLWWRQCCGIMLAVGGQHQWSTNSGGTEEEQGIKCLIRGIRGSEQNNLVTQMILSHFSVPLTCFHLGCSSGLVSFFAKAACIYWFYVLNWLVLCLHHGCDMYHTIIGNILGDHIHWKYKLYLTNCDLHRGIMRPLI